MESENSNLNCVRCETPLKGKFCHNCGERVLSNKDASIWHLVTDFLGNLFNFDNKFFQTLLLVLKKPGELTRLYKIGVRKKYLKPVQLYLIANLIYFLFPVVDSLNTTLHTQMTGLPYSRLVRPKIERQIEKAGMDFNTFQEGYNKQSKEVGKLIVIILVPLIAILFQFLYWRSSKMTFVDHTILSFNFISLLILGGFILFPIILFLGLRLLGINFSNSNFEGIMSIYLLFFVLGFLGRAFNRLIGGCRWVHYLKVLLVAFLLIPILMIYRFVLLWVTLALV